jgi:hypothetical protein
MTVTKKENSAEQIGRERDRLDNSEVFIGNAFDGFRGRFPFSGDHYNNPDGRET